MESIVPFHPVLEAWFTEVFGAPTDVQSQAWRRISAMEHTLIAAPTGSGKTLAALLPCLDRVVRSEGGPGVKILYITPLKALNNDIHHHLFRFTAEMSALARERGLDWPGLTIGVRTGDTSQSTRASMLRHPPDLLVTTPESFYLMLTSLKGREILRTVRQVIVDEIHDLAADKRGVHLSLSLERLNRLCGQPVQRIGVSATQKPIWRVARYLGGWEERPEQAETLLPPAGLEARQEKAGAVAAAASRAEAPMEPRPVTVVESAMDKRFEVRVTLPVRGVRALDKDAVWTPLVERLMERMEGCRSVLIFVNNRRLCERLTLRLNDYAGHEMARSHHGSVSREKRLEVESLLKSGALRCLVATSTLELGIDVGHVDLVIQVDSPKLAAAGIQRIGRAGHSVGDASRGVIAVRSRGDLAEAAVLAKAIMERDIEEIRIPQGPLDVLAQQTVSAVAADDWSPEELYRLFTRSDCYRELSRERFLSVLDVLSGLYPYAKPLIGWNRPENRLHKLPATPMAASMGAGTIPQSSAFPVHHVESRVHLGELDEEFVHESRVGDVFQLGTSSWIIRSIKQDRIYVAESGNALSEIPFWRAEAGGRSPEIGIRIGRLLNEIRSTPQPEAGGDAMLFRLTDEYRMEEEAARELLAYVRGQAAVCAVPTDTLIVAEHYKDDAARHHLVLHSLYGRRINRTWEMALRARFDAVCRLPVYSAAKDDGIEFVFPEWDPAWLSEITRLAPEQVERLLWELLPGTSMLGKAFREVAETALLLTKGFVRQSSWKKRYRSEELLKESLPYADRFPFLREAYRVCLDEQLDVPGLLGLLYGIREGRILLQTAESLAPSPFAMRFTGDYIMTALYESDALGRDVQMKLLNVNRSLASAWFGGEGLRGLISPAALGAVRERLESLSLAGDRELDGHAVLRLLKERGDLTGTEVAEAAGEEAGSFLTELERTGSACRLLLAGEERWICRDEEGFYAAFPEEENAARFILKRYVEHRLIFTEEELSRRYALDGSRTEYWIRRWLQDGVIERSPFGEDSSQELYTASKVAERVVRTSVQQFRESHRAVEPNRYARWLLERHRLTPRLRLDGDEGLLEALRMLQGLFLPLSYWEAHILPARVSGYRKEMLDRLCASGEVFWIGRKDSGEKEGRLAFFLTDSKELAAPYLEQAAQEPEAGSAQPELYAVLLRRGASFLSALARETGQLPSELMGRLMELVWEGRVANDQFAPLRTAAAVKGKPDKAGGFQSGLGRWYALVPDAPDTPTSPRSPDSAPGGEGREAPALAYCRHWMAQYGLLTRAGTAYGALPYSWEMLSAMLKRLEDWGMVTRGFFVRTIAAMQFSTREQVENLQGLPAPGEEIVAVAAVDPANPYGAWIDWPDAAEIAFSRKPGNFLVYAGDRPVLWLEGFGKSVAAIPSEEEDRLEPGERLAAMLADTFRLLLARYHLRKIQVERWNGTKAAQSEAAGMLLSLGGERDRDGFVFWPSALKGI
ncbi:DEAD/DEAH box helicase [Gorillibacterium sp. sgz5001074]|uniref:DEAD/DEAH box helicase n=1 Tax=Gorillibacterium sp. sgz5001074 TaxID=3446695 RepID=UPI003F66E674